MRGTAYLKTISLILALTAALVSSACQSRGIQKTAENNLPKPTVNNQSVKLPTSTRFIQSEPPPISKPSATLESLPVAVTLPPISIASIANPPTETPAPEPTATIRSFRLPSPTPQPQMAHMRITKPGPYSRIVSPLQVESLISPGDDGMVHVDLYGEDGRLMVSQLLDFRNFDAKNFFITPEISFQINSAAELARLVISTYDQFGQMISLVSVDIILIQMGMSDITAPQVELEPYLVSSPREGSLLKGGSVALKGAARLVNDNPLIIQLIDEKGNVVGSGQVEVSQPSAGMSHVPFEATVTYQVDHRTRVRLSLHQESAGRIPGNVWLSSSILFLDP